MSPTAVHEDVTILVSPASTPLVWEGTAVVPMMAMSDVPILMVTPMSTCHEWEGMWGSLRSLWVTSPYS